MVKTIIKVDEGCESIYETATNELEKIDSDIEAEKVEAFAAIEAKYANKKARLINVIGLVAHEEIIEEPDEVVAENAEVTAEEPVIEEEVVE